VNRLWQLRGDDAGAAAVILVLLTPVFFSLAGLVVDGGRAITARQRATDIAEQAARAGVDALDVTTLRSTGIDAVDPAGGAAAACRYVYTAAPDAGCTASVTGNTVRVAVTTRTPTILLGLIGVSSFRAAATAAAAPVTGVRTGEVP
jgi:Flp pilus assembly protein TadG